MSLKTRDKILFIGHIILIWKVARFFSLHLKANTRTVRGDACLLGHSAHTEMHANGENILKLYREKNNPWWD